MSIKYIGRKTDFKGKTLWEIIGNLKNFGVGRIIARSMFERYEEPCYMKIVKVETLPNPAEPSLDNCRKVRVWVQKTFRGRTLPNLVQIESASYKSDYKLIPKDEEQNYCKCDKEKVEEKILPQKIDFPPLLREIVRRDLQAKGINIEEDPKMTLVFRKSHQSHYRIAKDGEIPNVNIECGLGKPVAPELYSGI